MECPDIGPFPVATISGIIDDGDVRQAVRPGKLRNNPAVPPWHRFDRDIERGEEIQEDKARRPGAKKKKGMKKAKRAKRAKSKKRAPKPAPAPTTAPPQPAPVPPTVAGTTEDQ